VRAATNPGDDPITAGDGSAKSLRVRIDGIDHRGPQAGVILVAQQRGDGRLE
jgi:hypothetical protein